MNAKKNGPVRTVTPNPIAWEVAISMAGGKTTRLFTMSDRSVIIANSSKRPKWVR